MENKNVGWLIIGIAGVMAIIVWLFNSVLKDVIGATCSHGPSCGMYTNLSAQTWISVILIAIVAIIGLIIMFTKPKERIIVRKIKEKKKRLDLKGLDKDERNVIKLLQKESGAMFQKTLMEKIEVGKVKMTRLLDKLEAKQFVERKRRGMNNIVVLRN
ncbi:hypothetical protein GOV13_00200 [Candidatus Pacearchaeota archaeon]|nr:hypothetical protein [Candidatus Pacearchaeota archaeon]